MCLCVCVCDRQWLNALDNHLSSLPTSSSTTTATSSSHSAPVLLPDMAAAQSELAEQHSLLTSTLQHAIDTVRANNLELVPDGTNDTPATTAATPTKRRKTAQPQQSTPRSEAPVEVEEASRVVVARAEVDNMLDQVNELLKKERLEWRELHTFLAAHPQQHSGADVEAAGGVEAGGVVGRGGSEVGNAIGGVAGGVNAGSGSAGSSQLSSPSSGHSKQVAAGLAKRLNRSSAM